MAKYHLNNDDQVLPCGAKEDGVGCPYQKTGNLHFEDEAAVERYYNETHEPLKGLRKKKSGGYGFSPSYSWDSELEVHEINVQNVTRVLPNGGTIPAALYSAYVDSFDGDSMMVSRYSDEMYWSVTGFNTADPSTDYTENVDMIDEAITSRNGNTVQLVDHPALEKLTQQVEQEFGVEFTRTPHPYAVKYRPQNIEDIREIASDSHVDWAEAYTDAERDYRRDTM